MLFLAESPFSLLGLFIVVFWFAAGYVVSIYTWGKVKQLLGK